MAVDDEGFFFALATAPAHVEDKLDDAWLSFAKEEEHEEEESREQKRGAELRQSGGGQTAVPQTPEKGLIGGSDSSVARGQPSAEENIVFRGVDKDAPGGRSDSSVGTPGILEQLKEEIADLQGRKPSSPPEPFSDWEVVADSPEKDAAGGKEEEGKPTTLRSESLVGESFFLYPDGNDEKTVTVPRKATKARGTTVDPTLEYNRINVPYKVKKTMKVAMEAMLRGIEKFSEEEEKHNVAAWHNAKCP